MNEKLPEKKDFKAIIDKLSDFFPGAIPAKSVNQLKAWFEVVKDLPLESISRAAAKISREVEYLRPGTNVGALLRGMVLPRLTEATIQAHINRARSLFLSPEGRPYEYLKGISPRLLELVENSGLFDRETNQEQANYQTFRVAKMFLEEKENAEKGFAPMIPANPKRPKSLPEPITKEQAEKNLARLKAARENRKKPKED